MSKKVLVDLDFCNSSEIQNVKAQKVPSTPSGVVEAQFWYDTASHTLKVYNGTKAVDTCLELATDAQVETGTSETLAVNPKQLATKINLTEKGANNGVATLGADGKIPSSQLPSYVDDVIDAYIVSGATALSSGWLSATDGGSALTPETGKIYIVLSTGDYLNKTYRWSGSVYVEVSSTPTRKYVVNNTSLTASQGKCTWAITHNLGGGEGVSVHVYEVSSGNEVLVDVTLTSASTATVTILSSSNIAADTYKAVVIGG